MTHVMNTPMDDFPEHYVPGTTPGEKFQIRAALQQQRQRGSRITITEYLSNRWGSAILEEWEDTMVWMAHHFGPLHFLHKVSEMHNELVRGMRDCFFRLNIYQNNQYSCQFSLQICNVYF